jgi:IS5 family transposase
MSLWEILVLGVVRLNLNVDYDRLHHMANYDQKLRGILGVHPISGDWILGKAYKIQTIKDNVSLLDEETLVAINLLVVSAGHNLKKKEEKKIGKIVLQLKTDSFAVESKIHFPTDFNLVWDSIRKCLDLLEQLGKSRIIPGFRKIRFWRKKSYSSYRKAAEVHRKKGNNYQPRLKDATAKYLERGNQVLKRVKIVVTELREKVDLKEKVLLDLVEYFYDWGLKLSNLLHRRVILGEKIPHSEKVFSIFEPHTEWLQKGKAGNKVELGHNVSITTDQWGLIVDWEVVEKLSDKQLTIGLGNRLEQNYGEDYELDRISFDRGYYSLLGEKSLQKKFRLVVMPKPWEENSKARRSRDDDRVCEISPKS